MEHDITKPGKTTVLFTRTNSIYNELNTDTWDINRDATNYTGNDPVIAHPPCRAWGNFSQWAKPREGEKMLAVWATKLIQKNGGVLEHPKTSKIWETMKLPKPGQIDKYGGWTLNIDQYWFGHRAIKNTTLYIVGTAQRNIPDIPIKFRYLITPVEQMGKQEREATPKELAKWLIKLIEIIKENKKNNYIRTLTTKTL